MKRILSLALCCVLALCALSGCGEIAGNVADAAMEELENQVKSTLEENKLEVVEIKTAYGCLTGDGEHQFFLAALVRSQGEAVPQAAADALAKVFTDAGLAKQTESRIESQYLVEKTLEFDHSDFSGGDYYLIFAYQGDLTAGMPSLT